MDLELANKTVAITGGSKGIGLATAASFLHEGAAVTIVGSRQDALEKAQAELNRLGRIPVEIRRADLASPGGMDQIADLLGSVDILVNNAGAIPGGGLDAVDEETWRKAWELKVYGYVNAARISLPAMMARGTGVIINIVGIAGATPSYDYICGATANAGLMAFTMAAGAHSTSRNVRVVGLNPGPTETDRLLKLYKARAQERFGDAERWREMLSHLPFGRPAYAHEIADLAVFCASARASYLSGVVIDVDAGARYGKP